MNRWHTPVQERGSDHKYDLKKGNIRDHVKYQHVHGDQVLSSINLNALPLPSVRREVTRKVFFIGSNGKSGGETDPFKLR